MTTEASSNHETFVLPVRVYYEDTDAGGVVYHSNYINFFERARTEFMRHMGYELDQLANDQGIIFVVRTLNCDYLKAAKFNDELFVSAEIIEAGKTRIQFEQKISRKEQCEGKEEFVLLSTANVTVVCVEVDSFKPKRLPKTIKENLERVI